MNSSRPLHILVVDDDEDDFFMIREILAEIRDTQLRIDWKSSFDEGLDAVFKGDYDVHLVDYRLGANTGLDLIKSALAGNCKNPFILLTGFGDHEVDLEAMRIGAADFLVKDQLTAPLLERAIRYSIYHAQALQTMREREESFRNLLDSTFEGVVVHEKNGQILVVNRAAAEIFGYTPEEMTKRNLFGFFEPPKGLKEADLPGSISSANELMGFARDGSQLYLEVGNKPYQYRGRSVYLTAIRDITSRKQMETQIFLQDRLASVGLLASSLAHEIGTPLGIIRGRAELLSLQTKENKGAQENTEIIISQIDRVTKLIRSLLNLARGDTSAKTGVGLINSILDDVLRLMAHDLTKNHIDVRNRVPADLSVRVRGETEPLHQVFLNLIVNSVHAIESAVKSGRATGHFIQIGVEGSGPNWEISVTDSGIGISEEHMRHLFKPFFTTKDVGLGTGLGLATSYRIVEKWGGTMKVKSQKDKGATFTISLPKGN